MRLTLQATPEEVMRAVDALRESAQRHGLSEKTIFGLSLALEESGGNIVRHALQQDAEKTFQVSLELADGAFVIELRDSGPEFDPTLVPPRKPREEDDVGGWGIPLVRRYVDELDYQREAGENVLRLTKRLGETPARH